MRVAYWITKATDTHSEYVILLSTATRVARTRVSVTLYIHCLLCIIIISPHLAPQHKLVSFCYTWLPTNLHMTHTRPVVSIYLWFALKEVPVTHKVKSDQVTSCFWQEDENKLIRGPQLHTNQHISFLEMSTLIEATNVLQIE
jgi:hypothetical protein